MKKTTIGQGRKLLLRGEVIAQLKQTELQQAVGGAGEPGSIFTPCSHPSTAQTG